LVWIFNPKAVELTKKVLNFNYTPLKNNKIKAEQHVLMSLRF